MLEHKYLIRQTGHLTLQTTDLRTSLHEAEAILGLRVVEQTKDRAILTSGPRRGEITLVQGETSRVLAVGLEAYNADCVAEARSRAEKRGLEVLDEDLQAPGVSDGFRFKTPWGHLFEIHTAVPRDQPVHYPTAGARPLRLDHVSLKAADTLSLQALLSEVLNLRLSDRTSGNEFIWMRAGDRNHHLLGITVAPQAGLHHYSFEAPQVSDLCRLADTLRLYNRTLFWGIGHHGAGTQSYFTYHLDTQGCIVEYSQGMAQVDDDDVYGDGTVWPITKGLADDWINMWGPPPPANFAEPGLAFTNVR